MLFTYDTLVEQLKCICERSNCELQGIKSKLACFEECGDGVVSGTEECDDGNNLNDDGCSQSCKFEIGFDCMNFDYLPTICNEICGDALIVGIENCDDGSD